MDLLDRLLGHDAWTTRQLLLRARKLTDDQLDRRFDIGHETLRCIFDHVVANIEVWTDLMAGRPVRPDARPEDHGETVEGLIARLDAAAADFGALARRLRDDGRLDDRWVERFLAEHRANADPGRDAILVGAGPGIQRPRRQRAFGDQFRWAEWSSPAADVA